MNEPKAPSVTLDPEIAEFVEFLQAGAAAHPTLADMPASQRRKTIEAIRGPLTVGGPAVDSTSDYCVAGNGHDIRIRVYHADPARPRPTLVYLHGGGWVMFSLQTHDRVMRELAARADVAVVGIDYGLAPEHRFPTQLEQIEDCLSWLATHGAGLGLDMTQVAIGGDSAGANLTVSTCLRLRDAETGLRPSAMLLFYGAYDSRCDGPSVSRFDGPEYNLGQEEMRGFWAMYVNGSSDYANPQVSPILADLSGLPPTFMAIAEADILFSENLAMAERLRRYGVPVDANVYPGTVHSFLEAVSMAKVSERALDEAALWTASKLRPTTAPTSEYEVR